MRKAALIAASVVSISSFPSLASTPEDELQTKIESEINSNPTHVPLLERHSVADVADALRELSQAVSPCENAAYTKINNHITLSTSPQHAPCRLYDLAMPTLKSMNVAKVSRIPIQSFGAADLLAWIDNPLLLQNRTQDFQKTFTADKLKDTWFSELSFANEIDPTQLEFTLANISQTASVELDPSDISALRDLASLTGDRNSPLLNFANNPKSIMHGISLKWNNEEKAFDVFANLQILPLFKTAALVDFEVQYKYAAEKLVRGALLQVLEKAIAKIPNATVRNVVSVAISDSFEFVELEYAYQMRRLERNLEDALQTSEPNSSEAAFLEKSLNVLTAQQSSLVQQYILAKILNQKFDIKNLDKLGHQIRFANEKTKQSLRLKLHSDLVTEKNCSITILEKDFAVCETQSNSQKVYSLLSSNKVFKWDFGANLIYNSEFENQILLKRKLAWAISSAIRIKPLLIPSRLAKQFVTVAKSIATSGMLDEGTLLGALDKTAQNTTNPELELKPRLRLQNIVPFAPKSDSTESRIIDINELLLKSTADF